MNQLCCLSHDSKPSPPTPRITNNHENLIFNSADVENRLRGLSVMENQLDHCGGRRRRPSSQTTPPKLQFERVAPSIDCTENV